ncbi:DUF5683 domain-containing protein [Mucilaginibacter auburnensis]|uniref:DUF5683 domain-containing protein n=1 Tax=Mucilaginibacter auburnensis TaxID=1457233 RepID=A0A2H9VTN8_9SPHI|nr:DUF5683 domain-containing protein [Mucilaginibacter auburnensis]PJJ84186.1 hypothetical protein CLV57_1195 [Mucilaginibacter auburnensis]
MLKQFVFFLVFIGLSSAGMAQRPDFSPPKTKADSVKMRRDSLRSKAFAPSVVDEKIYHPDSTHSPRKAVMHSLMIPGWGQVYNKKWWKVPIVYGGLGLIGWMYAFNQSYYTENLTIARYRREGKVPKAGDPYYETYQKYATYGFSDQAINDAVRGYRRYRDLSVLLFAGMWGLQIIDAYIDAKFIHSYTMDNNLSFKISPQLLTVPMYAYDVQSAYSPGLKVTFTFR